MKIQNGGYIQDGIEMFIFFAKNFQKLYFCKFFFLLFTLGKNTTFMEKLKEKFIPIKVVFLPKAN
jgi:hypothetical protein